MRCENSHYRKWPSTPRLTVRVIVSQYLSDSCNMHRYLFLKSSNPLSTNNNMFAYDWAGTALSLRYIRPMKPYFGIPGYSNYQRVLCIVLNNIDLGIQIETSGWEALALHLTLTGMLNTVAYLQFLDVNECLRWHLKLMKMKREDKKRWTQLIWVPRP